MHLTMPTRTQEYILMGIVAGIIAGIVLVYIFGVTYAEMLRAAETIRNSFKVA